MSRAAHPAAGHQSSKLQHTKMFEGLLTRDAKPFFQSAILCSPPRYKRSKIARRVGFASAVKMRSDAGPDPLASIRVRPQTCFLTFIVTQSLTRIANKKAANWRPFQKERACCGVYGVMRSNRASDYGLAVRVAARSYLAKPVLHL